jgi:drug/metabolite transporter (DMT)-like permease
MAAPNASNVVRVFNPVEGVPARFLSLASFELARFVGRNTEERAAFLRENLWLAPFAVLLGAVGFVQPALMIVFWFRRRGVPEGWRQVRLLALSTVVLLCALFLFTAKLPASHTFYVTFPVAALYGFYCWDALLRRSRGWRWFALVFLVCGIIFHIGLAAHNFSRVSLYVNRRVPATAIDEPNPALLGERRPGSLY